MELSNLIKNLNVVKFVGNNNPNILGVAFNSKQVKKGYVFVCLTGSKTDGVNYVLEAINNGAVACVAEQELSLKVPLVVVKNARVSLSLMCKQFYGNACDNLKIIMVTGTNGKTSVCYLINSILKYNNFKCALIGTNGIFYDNKQLYYGLTTPDPTELHYYFNELKNMGVTHVVMEASAHAIKLNKLVGIKAEQIIFTNLTEEHLDYFYSMEEYSNTKLNFINASNCNLAITNVDDGYGVKVLKSGVQTLSYGLVNPADTFALNITNKISGLEFCVNVMDEIINIKSSLCGLYNVYNLMAAITSAHCLGVKPNVIKKGIENLSCIPGRFNKYFLDLNKLVVVDFAHTPDGFLKLLSEVKTFRRGKIITMFGCVGYSDSLKRKHMAEVASKFSDEIILTTDNPNFVKFADICQDVLKGVSVPCTQIENRAEAIKHAMFNLKENDTLLILGKGAETSNLINGIKVPHSDLAEVEYNIQNFYNVKKGDCIDTSII
ncbi:MAG: UDP-N-acetylmuramoyl-L-alanyl-D-glutamate--2,6-diaminopimelate ligase [Clostridia bacterium]|nr:UDP-N-acetylmuramoyl-L-alanyl-D-glutamate--2,6-diaminopimelate ligase [Clostridia bacterium]